MLRFLGIGAQKAGTTWLYTILSQHPEIYFPGGKEQHFWNAHYNGHNIDTYLKQFNQSAKAGGDITPAYGHLPISTIKDIYSCCPHLKIIYILRNPIERAWSSALMALKRAELEYDEVDDQWFITHFRSSGSISRGNYLGNLKNWHSAFSQDQVLVLLFDELEENPNDFLGKILNYLGLKCFFPENIEKKVFKGGAVNFNAILRQELLKIYTDQIENLSSYLKLDLSKWLKERE